MCNPHGRSEFVAGTNLQWLDRTARTVSRNFKYHRTSLTLSIKQSDINWMIKAVFPTAVSPNTVILCKAIVPFTKFGSSITACILKINLLDFTTRFYRHQSDPVVLVIWKAFPPVIAAKGYLSSTTMMIFARLSSARLLNTVCLTHTRNCGCTDLAAARISLMTIIMDRHI